jgi:O-Antigen ligase
MTSKAIASLREAPATIPALVAIALFFVWSTSQLGYPVTHWAPGGLLVLALLGVALSVVRLRLVEVPLPVRVALACLAGYTVLSFASIAWAAVPGEAWEGADRTLLYLLVFALFALWPQQGRSAALIVGVWTLATIGLAAFVALHVDVAAHSTMRLASLFPGGRLVYPSGYANANAAQWLIAFWPALLLARSERLPWGLRGVLAGGAVLLAEVALLSQSRGALYATPVMLVLVFALLPERVRTFVTLLPVAAGIAVAAPAALRVGERLEHGHTATSALHTATIATFAAALVVGLVVALGAAIEGRLAFAPPTRRHVHQAIGAVAIAMLVALLAGGWALAGNPVTRARHAWDTFKSENGYAADSSSGSRLTSGLGSTRYDFYRVALDEFVAHPIVGIGADNFFEPYLQHRRSEETPHYPHSVELRTLTETGLLGGVLALVGVGGALLACWRAVRRPDRLTRTIAAAALAGFGYWVVHGSFDWFWEFAGLGAPAFALLGIACALAPRADAERAAAVAARSSGTRLRLGLVAAGGVLAVLAAGVSLAAPWLSQLEVQSAARIWPGAPRRAYARLDDAARLNPLSDEAYLVAGSIALRFHDLTRADNEFALALKRVPADAYATLERGAIASARGDRRSALELLGRAALLNPRDSLTREALMLVREGRRLNVEALNRSILLKAQQLA